MHQHNGLFQDGSPVPDERDSKSPSPSSNADPTSFKPARDTPEQTEWSAVGHAATGKSGRVIHNLQEEIARLTRDLGVYRSKTEEATRLNETFKIQYTNAQERLRNLEQVNETNLNSIARKDKKIEELRTELQHERVKRQDAEEVANLTNSTMREEREIHHRAQAHALELAKHYETQYDVLSGTLKRDKAELGAKIKALWEELYSMQATQQEQSVQTERLEVLADQKNREIAALKESNEKLMTTHAEYKQVKDNELRETIERTNLNNTLIDKAIDSMKTTEAQMRWAIKLHESKSKE
ncbi:hypothetical protein N7468_005926 [Penicillium chermesinum]|uniref:SWI5-dependent HO expression protein 3 n=1 Tax=Penicillium chermesinum TaxID=63820 RepID=A0A9W9P0D0_9EURO|nr:uncharacterized protein N7468_005926 [Penicillium chermesinum]KAJ5232970.1 hypothetical protein N7468_005926 [Penicillium chermesinum]